MVGGLGRMSAPGRIRVVHVIQNMNYGGMERMLADLIAALDQSVFQQHLVVLQYLGRFAKGLEQFAQLQVCPPMARGSLLWPRQLVRVLRRLEPDIVHTHSGVWFKGSWAARMAHVPVVVHTEHGRPSPDKQPGRFIDSVAARWTDRVVAVSDALVEQVASTITSDRSRIRRIVNGIPIRPMRVVDATAVRRALSLEPGSLIIGSVGRLEPIKGPDLLVEAFALLQAAWPSEPRPALVVIGEGSLRSSVEARATSLGVAERIRWLGWRDDVDQWLPAFDLFTLTSRSEGTSISLLEAMAAGRCPVVTDVGGNREVLGPELAHRLVRTLDPAAIAAGWRAALSDGRLHNDVSLGRRRVESSYSIAGMVAAYETLYTELLGRPGCL